MKLKKKNIEKKVEEEKKENIVQTMPKFEHKGVFKNKVMEYNLKIVGTNLNEIPPEQFTNFLLEIAHVFNHLGKSLSLAFSDVTAKCDIIMRITNSLKNTPNISGLQSIIKHEIKKNVHILNGENNSQYTKDKSLISYESLARTVLRLLRFLDFLEIMFSNLYKTKDHLSTICKIAYGKALAPYHTFMIRLVAKAA